MALTDEAPGHSQCPEGDDSWCSYNRALASYKEPQTHKNPLPGFIHTALEPIFQSLGDQALLEQNAIESLHSVTWSQNSKSMHDSLLAVERAVAEAVSRFSQGMAKPSNSVTEQLG
ncbi:hypothetical protein HPB47_027551 [Ixodes persulcatus]|uniref:Uncharacterized protein n=1 Tax=Ixodes persulcatus TaxID=34615 RepID=A0AC60PW29_IXOPE|nr:hypothetical protein HPB47_027551 [Ixodes persulcatus]